MIVDITTTSGVDFIRGFTYQQSGGAPINLTGLNFLMMVRAAATDPNAVVSLSVPNGGVIITNAVGGNFTLWIRRANLALMDAGTYVQSLVVVNLDGTITEIWHGALTHTIGATR